MQMDHNLQLETTQKLLMTPQLRQAISILQLSSTELVSLVEKELLENPILEVDESQDTKSPEEPDAIESEVSSMEDLYNVTKEKKLDYDEWSEYFSYIFSDYVYSPVDRNKEQVDLFSIYPVSTMSLHEHLEMQLNFSLSENKNPIDYNIEKEILKIGKFLIGCIDENGYLRCSISEASSILKVSPVLVEQVLNIIKTFDPVGVGARNLAECLLIQINQTKCCSSYESYYIVKEIIENHLVDIGEGKLKKVSEALKISIKEVQNAIDIIRKLEPKPGGAFSDFNAEYIHPDVIVAKDRDDYVITLNDKHVPMLSINPYYRQITRNKSYDMDGDTKKFVEDKLNSALWLIRSIEQRRQTIVNVTRTIVDMQREFFDSGANFLKPLVMRQVAEQAGIHESTVSRTVANKYIATPHGIFSMSSFFTKGLQGVGGVAISTNLIKRELKDLITHEDSRHPLSDSDLVYRLGDKGIRISRRTVTKYRKELNIPSSTKRRRY
ncbi:RNA polymerase factor sigma-54, partial [Selenomonadales bacterium OttesenSCG-928-I06]|nr:RNA polymerase factor sigma-54 [Selenomonadales bacterium OttesenSCG-928-I06]